MPRYDALFPPRANDNNRHVRLSDHWYGFIYTIGLTRDQAWFDNKRACQNSKDAISNHEDTDALHLITA